jgi:ubiquinone/menaquinone biosynthesis C-methylase UbiE
MTEADQRVRRIFEKTASAYDGTMDVFERLVVGEGRRWVCSRAEGDVLEVAIGTGRNLPLYPQGIRLTGVDISPSMLERAVCRADELGVTAELREGNAAQLEFDDDSFDTVVFTLSLCTIPDDRAAVAEARRVLRPGGAMLLCEHVRSPAPLVRLGQHVLEPACVHMQNDHLLREPIEQLEAEGLVIEETHRYKWGIMELARATTR